MRILRRREVKGPQGQTLEQKEGVNLGLQALPRPSYFCAHQSSPPHNLKAVTSVPSYRRAETESHSSHSNPALCTEATPRLATPQPAPGPLLRLRLSKYLLNRRPCQAFLTTFLWSVGVGVGCLPGPHFSLQEHISMHWKPICVEFSTGH